MGVLTLADFRTDVDSALGDLDISPTIIDRFINLGYLDVVGSVNFSELDTSTSTVTVAATQTVAVPSEAIHVYGIRDTTSLYALTRISKTELLSREVSITGSPKYWARFGSNILLHPVPNAAYNITIYHRNPVTVLSSADDVTDIPATWDAAVFMLAVHYGFMSRGEIDKAMAWLHRALLFMKSRITEDDLALGQKLALPGIEARLAQFESKAGE